MISPTLQEYSFKTIVQDEEGNHTCRGVPCLLDSDAMKTDVILLLDSFFHVLVWRGEQIQQWHEQNYHLKPEYENFKHLLEAPAREALEIIRERTPAPKYIQTYANHSQARFLLSKVNPAKTHTTNGQGQGGGQNNYDPNQSNVVLTDDVSYRVFLECLIKYAVQST